MGKEFLHDPVKLVIPVLYSDKEIYEISRKDLLKEWGKTDFESDPFHFEFTDYYNSEMGLPIFRVFLSFSELIPVESMVEIKKTTNQIELKYAVREKRKVNLDPGYLELGKFVLATTKDQQHRLYIGNGIFEEITLYYRDKDWRAWEWTYPDYRSEKYKDILLKIRELYKAQIKNCKSFAGL